MREGYFLLITTIRIDKNLQQQLKLKSVETGLSQLDLANRYIFDGLKRDETPKKNIMTLDEIESLLDHDKPEGNGLSKIDGIFESEISTNAVELKKQSFK